MNFLFANRWNKVGFGLVLFGWGPFLFVILMAAIGIWPDKNPNPVGLGMLFAVTFWPAVICFVVGSIRAWRKS